MPAREEQKKENPVAVLGIIGAGGIAQSQHLPNLACCPHARLKAICDRRKDLAEAMQRKYSVPEVHTDHRSLLADPEIQAVMVATREDMQAPLTLEALAAGKHVYVEKPVADTPGPIREIAARQRETGLSVAVGFNRRFAPAYGRARELLEAHGGARNVHYRISDDYRRGWGKNEPPWRRVHHEICHIFDLLRWLVSSEVASLYAAASREDDEQFMLKFRSGPVASIISGGYATPDFPKERLEAMADYGSLTVEDFVELRTFGWEEDPQVLRFAGHTHPDRDSSYREEFAREGLSSLLKWRRRGMEARWKGKEDPRAPHGNYLVDKGWQASLDHFALSVALGRPAQNAGPGDALISQILAEAAQRSRTAGQAVEIPSESLP